ncbi:hypothetical protein Goarm_003417 [Gossypium armourianum]|uniref:(+)-neomenthol dehydrogenase-like n=1 Tax=Gossypium armourianum TaxID=34283 RepID=A0A7J9K350_9ROSI|nr:hypothetical protein [Gossypium armourianum]
MESKLVDQFHFSSTVSLHSSNRWWSGDTVAVVTGANRGIGLAVVKRFAELGLTVVLTARDEERGKKATEKLREEGLGNVRFFALDVSKAASIKTFVSWVETTFGELDILVSKSLTSLFHKCEVESQFYTIPSL